MSLRDNIESLSRPNFYRKLTPLNMSRAMWKRRNKGTGKLRKHSSSITRRST